MTPMLKERFAARFRRSKELWERSLRVSRGIHHDSRHAQPFPIHMSHGKGSHKWDVDGNEYVDYTMGHGSLMFGHAHPPLVDALSQQLARGTHYGNEHQYGVEWAEIITRLVPGADKVEFVMTGTEANMMIAQLVRAYTGRKKILKFSEHFFGWSDDLFVGVDPPYHEPLPGRLPAFSEDAISNATVVIPANDRDAMEKALASRDIAALFIEGGGGHCGATGIPPELVRAARDLTTQFGTLLVIDEVITGFRWAPGGYQGTIGLTPDLTTLGKMVGGGLPGAAVCGRAEVMELLQIKEGQPGWNLGRRVRHNGTWNANPVSAVAGVITLGMVASGEPQRKAERAARRLADGINGKFLERGLDGCAHNASSVIHLHIGKCRKCDRANCLDVTKMGVSGAAVALDAYLLLNGAHILRGSIGWVSAVHTDEDIARTIDAFGRALDDMIGDDIITSSVT